jgi:2-alkenal reductase
MSGDVKRRAEGTAPIDLTDLANRWPPVLGVIVLAVWLSACSVAASTERPIADAAGTQQQQLTTRRTVADPTPTAVSSDLVAGAAVAQLVFQNLYERVSPSVVNIEVRRTVRLNDDLTGSGFVYDQLGHIVTNAHVILDASELFVTFNDGYVTQALIVGADQFSDLAVIKVSVPAERLLPVTFGGSSDLRVGQMVATIGNPFGLLSSMTTGIISATGRTLDSSRMLNPDSPNRFTNPSIIQIDAQINPGNSGGPLLDLNGLVIGVNTAIRTESGEFQGIGFAVPANTVRRVVPQLIQTGRAAYAWLGIDSSSVFTVASVAEALNLPVDYGVLITSVAPGSPAEAAGLRGGDETTTIRGKPLATGGDLIIAINGERLQDFTALLAFLIDHTAPGDTITLTIIRSNATFDVTVTLQERPQ